MRMSEYTAGPAAADRAGRDRAGEKRRPDAVFTPSSGVPFVADVGGAVRSHAGAAAEAHGIDRQRAGGEAASNGSTGLRARSGTRLTRRVVPAMIKPGAARDARRPPTEEPHAS